MKKIRAQKLIKVSCPLCEADNFQPFGSEHSMQVVVCLACGLTYTNPRLAHSELVNIYANYYHKAEHWQEYLAAQEQEALGKKKAKQKSGLWEARFIRLWPFMEKFSGKASGLLTALDVGAGSSGWSKWLRQRKVECWAFDIAENFNLVEDPALKSLPPLRAVVAPSLAEAGLEENSFDLITLWDVIEHFENPGAELQEITRLLKPGGIVFVQTPNAPWIHFKYKVLHYLPKKIISNLITDYGVLLPEQHLQYYSLATLEQQLEQAGLSILAHKVINWAEPGMSSLSGLAYGLTFAAARALDFLSQGRYCSNIGLSVVAKKNG